MKCCKYVNWLDHRELIEQKISISEQPNTSEVGASQEMKTLKKASIPCSSRTLDQDSLPGMVP